MEYLWGPLGLDGRAVSGNAASDRRTCHGVPQLAPQGGIEFVAVPGHRLGAAVVYFPGLSQVFEHNRLYTNEKSPRP